METHLYQSLFAIAIIQLLAVASPGPDFAIVTRTALVEGKKHALAVTLGILLGICVHLTWSITGIALLINSIPKLKITIQFIGAAFLFYMGMQCLLSNLKKSSGSVLDESQIKTGNIYVQIRKGFLTNVLNPKATLYFLSLSAQITNPSNPNYVKFLFALIILFVSGFWFSMCSFLITRPMIKSKFLKAEGFINGLTGVALLYFGVRLVIN